MKAQGALEYLIIVSAVLAIAAMVVLVLTGSFDTTLKFGNLSKCKVAASNCNVEMATTIISQCSFCEADCANLGGNLIALCKAGLLNEIYLGSNENCVNIISGSTIDGVYVNSYESKDTYFGSGASFVENCSLIEGSVIVDSQITSSIVKDSNVVNEIVIDDFIR